MANQKLYIKHIEKYANARKEKEIKQLAISKGKGKLTYEDVINEKEKSKGKSMRFDGEISAFGTFEEKGIQSIKDAKRPVKNIERKKPILQVDIVIKSAIKRFKLYENESPSVAIGEFAKRNSRIVTRIDP